MNPNSAAYWHERFASGDWERNEGRKQTTLFAVEQVPRLGLPQSFSGSILDFGCGLGDALPVYREAFPRATLLGIDHAKSAIELARKEYGNVGDFLEGGLDDIPSVDVIVASNVFEHIEDDLATARSLLLRCRVLYIAVPFREQISPGGEHLRSYDFHRFDGLGIVTFQVYRSKAWGHSLWGELYHVHLKNIARRLVNKKVKRVGRQILFRIEPLK